MSMDNKLIFGGEKMKKTRMIIVLLLVTFVATAVMLSGCSQYSDAATSDESTSENDRFVTVYSSSSGFQEFKIFEDTRSGVLYAYYGHGYGGGLSVLYNADGTVMTVR